MKEYCGSNSSMLRDFKKQDMHYLGNYAGHALGNVFHIFGSDACHANSSVLGQIDMVFLDHALDLRFS